MDRLIPKCPCGGFCSIHAVAVNDEFQLLFVGMCLDCFKKVESNISLTDLYKMSMIQRKGRPIMPIILPPTSDSDWYKLFGIREE